MHIKTIQVNNICLDNGQHSASAVELPEMNGLDECHTMNLSRSENIGGTWSTSPYVIYEDGEKPVIAAQGDSYIDQLEIAIPRICDDRCKLDAMRIDEAAESNRQRFLLLKKQLDRFHALSAKFQKLSFHVQTNHIKRYDFNGSIDIAWPKLINGPIEFDISQVGHELTKHVQITNPFDTPLQIHYRIHDVEQLGIEIDLPPDIIDECSNAIITEDTVFSLGDNKRQSEILTIPVKTYQTISVKFMSDNPGTYGTLLYVENNVTVLEAVWITAKSVVPQFKFGNRKPGSKTPLLFELTDKHLRDCNHPNVNMRSVTAKRTFTAKNSGEVPIFMRELRIDDMPCEGYGYRILECAPFELPPNGSRKIEISFTPDFTLAMVKKTLYLETSLNYSVNYTLLSMIAPLSLGVCSKALARPEWESLMKNMTAVVLAISFVFVLFVAYLDSMKVLNTHRENMSKAKGSLQPALDLRRIGLKSLFTEDASKNGSTSGTNSTVPSSASSSGTVAATQASTTTATTKPNVSSTPLSCNAKANGSICKKKSTEKKRVTCPSTELITPKKSYITEIARKFTPKKSSETKSKAEQTIKPKSSPPSMPHQLAAACGNGKKDKRPKDESFNANFEEEETSSTTTDSSSHSDDKSPVAKSKTKKSAQSKDLSGGLSQSKDKKNLVKKSKSLPLNYESRDASNTLNVPSCIMDKSNDKSMDMHHEPFVLSTISSGGGGGGGGDNIIKSMNNASDIFSVLNTPPSKSAALKLINGKTPGRERTKINDYISSYRNSSDADNSAFKSTAFEFSSPLAESPTSGNHPLLDLVEKSSLYEHQYNQDKLSAKQNAVASSIPLSSVLKQPASKIVKPAKQLATKLKTDAKSKDRKTSKKQSMPGDDAFSNHSSFENLTTNGNGKMSSPGIDLGPIGTRKSPSSTPIWEPMHSIHNPIPINTSNSNANSLNSLAGASNSFFTGVYQPQTSTYQRNDTNALNEMLDQLNQRQVNTNDQFSSTFRQQHQNAEVLRFLNAMYGSNNAEQHKPNLWDSTILLNILQQKQRQQQQQQQQQVL